MDIATPIQTKMQPGFRRQKYQTNSPSVQKFRHMQELTFFDRYTSIVSLETLLNATEFENPNLLLGPKAHVLKTEI